MVSGFKNGQNKFEEDFEIPLLFRILYYFHRRKCLGHFFVNVSYSKSSLSYPDHRHLLQCPDIVPFNENEQAPLLS